MLEAECNRRMPHRPRGTMRRRVSRPTIIDMNTAAGREYQAKMNIWLSIPEAPEFQEMAAKATGRTPIFYVTSSKSPSEISRVLARTPDMNIRDISGYTPLHLAVEHNNIVAVKLFMTRKPDVNIRDIMGDTPLHVASAMNDIKPEIIRELLVKKKCLNARNTNGLTPLHIATINNNIELMTDYLDIGAKTDIVDNENGWTPLHHAAMARHVKAAVLLLKYGANTNVTDQYGQTPLFNAVMGDDLRMVMDIVTFKGNIYICDNFGQTPIHLAARNPSPHILKFFLTNRNVNINCQNHRGQTLLHCAVEDKRYENIKAILQREPDLDIQDCKGLTPFDVRCDEQLIIHVIKLKAANLPFSQRSLDIVYGTRDCEFIEQHEQYCYEELERMKKMPFPGLLISYFQFTFAPLQTRAEYMMNKKVLLYNHEANPRVLSIEPTFPIYWGTIELRYYKARDRCEVLERFEHVKDRIFVGLPDHCISNILSHLDIKDIIRIIKAVQKLTI